jgi:bifunctional non-homologous end joining protein LigD
LYEPMLAILGTMADLDRPGYYFEPKLDGTRALCYVGSETRFINRRGWDITTRYPEISFRKEVKAESCVLDGEIVVFDGRGNPSFSLLQKREQARSGMAPLLGEQHPATYIAFDILELEGRNITTMPLEERRKRLRKVLRDGPRAQSIVATTDGPRLWAIVEARKLEGVMAKRADSVYEQGRRSDAWMKIKALQTVDCVIVGFTSEKRTISALALGLFFGNELRYMGRVGTGFTEMFLARLRPVLDALVIEDPPVKRYPKDPIIWVRPELVAEIEYLQLTGDGHFRAPSFRRLRDDKAPEECTLDTAVMGPSPK